MKEFFPYEYGYLLIDDEYCYLTNTGNWSEARALKEKGAFRQGHPFIRRIRMAVFIIVVGLGVAGFELLGHRSQPGIYIGIVLACAGALKVYHSMRRELGQTFCMEKRCITSETYAERRLAIAYTLPDGTEQVVYLPGVAEDDYEKIKDCLSKFSKPSGYIFT
ncbi:MAG: hypothetical protein ACHQRM_15295 [Bacteroidia bacterium]